MRIVSIIKTDYSNRVDEIKAIHIRLDCKRMTKHFPLIFESETSRDIKKAISFELIQKIVCG